ncbi:MAG: SPL family radical SAM protein [Acidobacteriaceae bacterium]
MEAHPPAALFPILPTQPVGMARLAAQATHADDGHLITFRAMRAKSLLNRSLSKRNLSLEWSINPYRGCEFACRYCYARYTHEFMELRDPASFEREIFVKENAAWLLRQELRQVRPGEEIAIGTATDPYQPIERKLGVTRSILEVLATQHGLEIGIVTKSALVVRDIPLLRRIAAHNDLVLHLTITTPDAALARILEPRAPRPDLRFGAVQQLRSAGLRAGILCSPLLPGITDTGRALDTMAAAAARVSASFLSAQPLFLKPCSKETYLGFIRQHFPRLEDSYRRRFESDAFVAKPYADRVRALVRAACRKHRLAERDSDALLTRELGSSASTPAPQLFAVADLLRKPPSSASICATGAAPPGTRPPYASSIH